jgi:TetR/AcrR family transcriptional repressor of nem operon
MARQSMREEIVDAALEQFHTHGFNGAGVKDITDAAGVPKGSFYNHFDSKEALAVVALRRYGDQRHLEHLADTDVEPVARLRAHFELQRAEQVARDCTRGCLIGNFGAEVSDHSELIRAAVLDGLRTWTGLVAATLAEARQAGSIRADLDPEATARFVVDAWEGTLVDARATRSATAFEPFFDLVFGVLLAP